MAWYMGFNSFSLLLRAALASRYIPTLRRDITCEFAIFASLNKPVRSMTLVFAWVIFSCFSLFTKKYTILLCEAWDTSNSFS